MDSANKIYYEFKKTRKFHAGNTVKKTSKLLKGKNKLLKAVSSSEGNGNQPRRRNCCHY
ncbi:MAG: hypothetical protein WAM95_00415 [Bacillus sp. (in: firmicutes)]